MEPRGVVVIVAIVIVVVGGGGVGVVMHIAWVPTRLGCMVTCVENEICLLPAVKINKKPIFV